MKEDLERTPLRTILTNFLNHIDTLENQRTHTYESEFQELKLFSESIKGTKQYSCSEGEKEVNRKKNRYKDILPFDVSRVVLNEYAGVPGSDYINANYIKGASGSPAYIASQGPLPHTVNDFWRMVVQCEVQVIVMACNEEEAGKHKCENYWVEGEGEEKQFGMVSLRLLKASIVCPDFSVRTMRLKYTNTQANTEERTVCQFHYSTWPDHGVPPLVRPLLDMVRLVRDTQASETLPVLIHCSAGCGRTGTICAIDYVWGLLRAGKLTKDFSLLWLVREMRRQRIAMVQTKEQYILVHQAVRELFKEQLRMIDSHPYENIDYNGLPLIKCSSPEPTYDSITPLQNTKAEEKQDGKEKETVPPLPQKKRFQILSSKQAKEVENLSERQRLVERGGSSSESVASTGSSGHRPRIATLRNLFERDSRQVARSHSLGSFRPAQPQLQPQPQPMKERSAQPIPGRGILKVPQRPALPVKRSKSLRVLGADDRCRLSIPPPLPSEPDNTRRLSLESNYDDLLLNETSQQPLSEYLSVDSIVAGLGIRERRNSFRQAVHNESQQVLTALPKKPNLLRSYTSVDMRYAREKPNFIREIAPTKPILKPKPNLRPKQNEKMTDTSKVSANSRQEYLSQQQVPHKSSKTHETNKPQIKASSSRTLTKQSMSLRLAPKPKREDCRGLINTSTSKTSTSQQADPRYSSGESVSCSSDKSSLNSKGLSNTPHQTNHNTSNNLQTTGDCVDFGNENTLSQPTQFQNLSSSSSFHDSPSSFHHLNNTVPNTAEAGQFTKNLTNSAQPPSGLQEYYTRVKPSQAIRKQTPPQNLRPVVYDSKNVRQNSSAIYGSVPKVPPPPYVEPGKNAQKPKSNHRQFGDMAMISNNDIYGRSQGQSHWQIAASSRDMNLPSGNKHNVTVNNNARNNIPETNATTYSRSVERRHLEPDYRLVARDMTMKKAGERVTDYRLFAPEPQHLVVSESKYLELQRRNVEIDSQRVSGPKHIEQMHRHNVQDSYSKTLNEKRVLTQDQLTKSLESQNRRKPDLKMQQDHFFRNSEDKRMINQEITRTPQESVMHFVERRHSKEGFNVSPSVAQRSIGQDLSPKGPMGPSGPYQNTAERNQSYRPISEELYPKLNVGARKPVNQECQQSQDPNSAYLSRIPAHPQGNWTPPKDFPLESNSTNYESEILLTQEVKMRRGSQDDLALCATTPSRVKRHASVVLSRHSLIEGCNVTAGDSGASPLSLWNQTSSTGLDSTPNQHTTVEPEDPWSGAVGVDLDEVAASINTKKDGKMMRAALEALHLRKASQSTPKTNSKPNQPSSKPSQSSSKPNPSQSSSEKMSQQSLKSNHLSLKLNQSTGNYSIEVSKSTGSPPHFQPHLQVKPPGQFRKQQQYL